jgi:hypothetical protein
MPYIPPSIITQTPPALASGSRHDREPNMVEKLTREQLYKLLWCGADERVRSEIGISDVGGRKTCAKADVPCSGTWVLGQAGGQKPSASSDFFLLDRRV